MQPCAQTTKNSVQMPEKHWVYRLTQEAFDQLRLAAIENPKAYLNPEIDFDAVLRSKGVPNYTEKTGIATTRTISLAPVTQGLPNRADRQALDFYRSFDGMTPNLATDERIWTWMTHFRLHSYSLKRWRRPSNVNLPNYIRSHWFNAGSTDAFWRHNTAARTWWIAHTAIKAAQASAGAFTAEEALAAFSETALFYHIPMYYNFTRDPKILAEFVRVILNEAKGINAEKGSYALLRELNLMGGTQLLSLLPRDHLRSRIVDEVERIMSDPALVNDRDKLRNRTPFRSLSLGAGVQSTVLALMADRGEYDLPKPDIAIFADTGWEPPSVYEHLDWLSEQLSFEVVRVQAGNIKENILNGTSPDGNNYLGIPAYLINADGTHSLAARQCTSKYKVRPINRYLRNRLGFTPGRRAPKHIQVEIWMGISADEVIRMKESREEWATNRYPLIELGFSRAQLLDWFTKNYPGRYLPRSSCIGCPYRSNEEWKWLKMNAPNAFEDAVSVDRALREIPLVRNAITRKGAAFLHRSRVPLAKVDFDDTDDYDIMMASECEGLCGI